MSRVNFGKLRACKLSEELAGKILEIVTRYNSFARDTVGRQVVRKARGTDNESLNCGLLTANY